jgi:hypothetical protein
MTQKLTSRLLRFLICLSFLLMVCFCPLFTETATAEDRTERLSQVLLSAVRNARFDQVIDYGPYNEACPGADFCPSPAAPIANLPNVDVAVIELDRNGRLLDVANVLLSRDYRNGVVVPIDRNYAASSVRFRRWDIERSDGGTFSDTTGQRLTTKGWIDNPPLTADDDIVPGREAARLQFMSPYPASLFKLLVGYYVMRLVDTGTLGLDQSYPYTVLDTSGQTIESQESRLLRDWMNPMLTYSDNYSTQALIKLLYDLNQIDALNAEFRRLGLATLQINNTNPRTGAGWQPGSIHMTALDTARLLWLIDGTRGDRPLWRRPGGRPVTSAELSDSSRSYLKGLLADQGFNEVLSTSNFCLAPNIRPGIPAAVPTRWIDPNDGTVTVDGIPYGQDVRSCNAVAEVSFAHKTGLTFNYGSDAGIVKSLRNQPYRHYIIAFLANQGYRYADPVFADRTSFPCFDAVGGICYTQRIPALAKRIDNRLR